MNQLELHKKIDELIKKRPSGVNRKDVSALISANEDARQYFFHKVSEKWLDWLWENGFLDAIKQKAEDPTRYSYRMPELNYLVRMAEKMPAKVVDIILKVQISKETFNPEVIDRFVHICSILPVNQLKRIIPKIHKRRWIPLMGVFNQWGFEYERMFQRLAEAKDYESIIILAKAVLSVKTKREVGKESISQFFDNPFYFNNLLYTKVFEYLTGINDEYLEKAFELSLKVMSKIVDLCSKEYKQENEKVFKVYDGGMLLNVDFFELELGQKDYLSGRDNIRELAATIVKFVKQLIGKKCEQNQKEARRIFKQYIGSFDDNNPLLPDSRAMWRLRLFILSLCPEVFQEELKKSLFRLFAIDHYYEIISGTEYLKALRTGFHVLSDSDKRDYVKHVIEYFIKKDQEKENEKENWHIKYSSKILSVIANQLTKEEKKEAQEKGFVIDLDYQSEPSIKMGVAGAIILKAPLSYEEFQKKEVSVIVEKLRSEWSPKELYEKYKEKSDFHHPINAEGLGEYLKKNIPERLQGYIDNADRFFDQEKLDPHYTYSYLRGVQEAIKNNPELTGKTNWNGIIRLFNSVKSIREPGNEQIFNERKKWIDLYDAWLAGWDSVHSAVVDVLQELLTEKGGAVVIDFNKYRNDILSMLQYLLTYPDPTPKDEQIDTAKIKVGYGINKGYMVSDPFTMAINSVRGRAFQTFVLFIYLDGKQLNTDVKKTYEKVLSQEKTRAIMFLFGHYLPTFYYRDQGWVKDLLPIIFPKEKSKKYLYTAAWEGYLVNNLYKEMFSSDVIQKLYERGIELKEDDYPPYQKHFKDPEEALAIHLALAFIYFPEFDFNHSLFKKFWSVPNIKAHKSFISFIGRHIISRESASEWIKQNKIDVEKLKGFWDWALENCNPEELTSFGFWINIECNSFDVKWLAKHVRRTLEKTNGYIEWEYGLIQSLPIFAKKAPQNTLIILRFYLFEEVAKHEPVRTQFQIDDRIYNTFKELYNNKMIKEKVCKLINDLLPYRNGLFWKLKSILNESQEVR